MKKDEDILKKRLIELSRIAYERDIYTFSEFLSLNELDLLNQINNNELYCRYHVFGGYKSAQRQMIKFIPDAVFYEQEYPFSYLKITAKSIKFSEKLTHRDYLGSLMGLGIDRAKLGDIININDYVVFMIHSDLADYAIKNLFKVRNTYVSVDKISEISEDYEPKYELISGSVQSIRLDSVISLVFKTSRSQSVELIEAGKVFINGRLTTSNGARINVGDFISVRGIGKIQLHSIGNVTRKGKINIEVKRYI